MWKLRRANEFLVGLLKIANARPLEGRSIDDIKKIRDEFDPSFYRAQYPEVGLTEDDCFQHFMTTGWQEGKDPSATFSVRYYLENNRDIQEAGLNPFVHYVLHGRQEGRKSHPTDSIEKTEVGQTPTDADMSVTSPFFDAEFYRRCYPNIAGNDRDLLIHYLSVGWREGLDPSPYFSTRAYLSLYPDIKNGGLNPLIHYAIHGRTEGRRANFQSEVHLLMTPDAPTVPSHLQSVLTRTETSDRPTTATRVNAEALDIHWVVPDFSQGSGGHMTIFRMVRWLEIFGHRCTVWIAQPNQHRNTAEARDTVIKYFQCVAAPIRFISDAFFATSGDIVIATGWQTAYPVASATGFAAKFYFVQDHECEFYSTGAESLLARASYDFDLDCLCAGPWLEQLMSLQYGRWARHFHLAVDKSVYKQQYVGQAAPFSGGPGSERKIKIALYARSHSTRRCVPLALMALDRLVAQGLDFEVHFFGEEKLPFNSTRYRSFNHGLLSGDELAALYNRCDIGICFSATNYSLVPQEMMACGLPVVELDVESTRAIFPEDVVTFAPIMPDRMADAIAELICCRDRRDKQRDAALRWVNSFSWEGAARRVEQAVLRRIAERNVPFKELSAPQLGRRTSPALDIVIPTYNGIEVTKSLIRALRQQKGADQMQIFCIDSSSTDGTNEWLSVQPDVSLTVIDQAEFQHGRTRNLAASLGQAPLIAFLTQDALPVTEFWAYDIRQMFESHPLAAGLFGRHIAYPNHSPFIREELKTHFERMLSFPLALSRDTDPDRWLTGEVGWRQFLHFYSDNNSAMRRAVWREIPYPEIAYGEDQVWARNIIEAGMTKLYAPTAVVMHSHDYDHAETYTRAKVEAEFFYKEFGYRLGDLPQDVRTRQIEDEIVAAKSFGLQLDISDEVVARRVANILAKYKGWADGLTQADSSASQKLTAEENSCRKMIHLVERHGPLGINRISHIPS